MRPVSRWLLAVALALAAPASHADVLPTDIVGAFVHLCGETSGDAVQALARADRQGWAPLPGPMRVPVFGGARWAYLDGRVLRSADGIRLLMVGTQVGPDGHSASSCAVVDHSPQPAAANRLTEALARWVGGEPVQTDKTGNFAKFAFRQVDDRHLPLSAGDAALSADYPPSDVGEVTLNSFMGYLSITYMNWR